MQEQKRKNTKKELLRAAERLFAEKGFADVSGKDIMRAAGARNESALQYHFGDINKLIEEVFSERFKDIESQRAARIAALDAAGKGDDVVALLQASIGPMFEACLEESGRLYARFAVQLTTDPRFNLAALSQNTEHSSITTLRTRLAAKLNHLSADDRDARLRLGLTISLFQAHDFARHVAAGAAPPIADAVREAALSLSGFLTAK